MRPQGARVTGLEPAVSVVTDGTAAPVGGGWTAFLGGVVPPSRGDAERVNVLPARPWAYVVLVARLVRAAFPAAIS